MTMGDRVAVLGSQRLALPAGPALPGGLAAYRGRRVIAGIRPEALALSSPGGTTLHTLRGIPDRKASISDMPGGSEHGAALCADVRVVESVGSEVHAFFAIDAPAARAAGAATSTEGAAEAGLFAGQAWNGVARLDARSAPQAGERVTFAVDTGRLCFFDPDTGPGDSLTQVAAPRTNSWRTVAARRRSEIRPRRRP